MQNQPDKLNKVGESSVNEVFANKSWESIELKNITTKITDGSHNPPKGIDYSEYKMISSRNLDNGALSFENCRYLSREDFDLENRRTDIQVNDILLSIVGTIGKVCVIKKEHGKFTMQRSLAVIKLIHSQVNTYYLARFFESPILQDYINSNSKGAAQKGIYLNSIKELKIPLPPLPTQHAIVARLDEASATLSNAKLIIQNQIDELDALWQSELSKIFINNNYPKSKLGSVIDNYDGKRIPIKSSERKHVGKGKYPYYGATGIIDYVDEYIFDGTYLLISEDGANLIARKYPIAFIAEGKFWVNNHAHIIKGKEGILEDNYLRYFISSANISLYITGSAQPKLSQGMMNRIPVPLPPLPEQQAIVSHLDELHQSISKLKTLYQSQLAEHDAMRESILDKAFKGELVA